MYTLAEKMWNVLFKDTHDSNISKAIVFYVINL